MPDNRNAWDKQNTVTVTIKLNKHTDADILKLLEKQENRQGFIKALLRKETSKGEA